MTQSKPKKILKRKNPELEWRKWAMSLGTLEKIGFSSIDSDADIRNEIYHHIKKLHKENKKLKDEIQKLNNELVGTWKWDK